MSFLASHQVHVLIVKDKKQSGILTHCAFYADLVHNRLTVPSVRRGHRISGVKSEELL